MQLLSRVPLNEKETPRWRGLGNVDGQVCHGHGSHNILGPPYSQTNSGMAGLDISPSHKPHQQPLGDRGMGWLIKSCFARPVACHHRTA